MGRALLHRHGFARVFYLKYHMYRQILPAVGADHPRQVVAENRQFSSGKPIAGRSMENSWSSCDPSPAANRELAIENGS